MFAGLIPGLNSVNWPENEVSPQVPAILTSLFNLPGQAFSATNATLFIQSLGFSRRDWSECRSFVLLIYFCIFIPIVVFALSSGKEESDTATEAAGESPETDDSPGLMRVFRNAESIAIFASSSGKEESDEGGDTATEAAGESPETDDYPGSIRVFRNGYAERTKRWSNSLFKALFNTNGGFILPESYNPLQSFCGICLEEKQNWQMFKSENCSHSFCYDCTSKHIEAKVQDNIIEICCPEIGCKAELGFEACRNIVSKDVIVRWDECLCMSLILESQKVYCPFKDCSAMLVNDTGTTIGETECPSCQRLICAKCRVPWHSEFTCQEFEWLGVEGEGREDVFVEELAKKKSWRKCRNCNMWVEKTEGCLHITCRCGYEFCYMCGSKWDKSHIGCRRVQESETSRNLPSPSPSRASSSSSIEFNFFFDPQSDPILVPPPPLPPVDDGEFRRPLSSFLSLNRP